MDFVDRLQAQPGAKTSVPQLQGHADTGVSEAIFAMSERQAYWQKYLKHAIAISNLREEIASEQDS